MPVTPADIKRLIKILGAKGAIAGLSESDISLSTLKVIAVKAKIEFRERSSRKDLIEAIIMDINHVNIKSTEQLMQMNFDELISYFNETMPSTDELLRIMKELNYKVGSEDKKNLRRFVARQISETALFAGVAKKDINLK